MKNTRKIFDSFDELINFIGKEEIYIQPHNFPDHDAIASAYALQNFLGHFGIKSKIVYGGELQRDNLKELITHLNMDIYNIKDVNMNSSDKIIIVDSSKGNKNVTDFNGDEIAVIDHHLGNIPKDVNYVDIRSDYGSCASVIFDYFQKYKIEIDKHTATAILTGISFDTALLTRGVNIKDLDAYFHCFKLADVEFVNHLTRNYIKIPDLEYYKYFTHNFEYTDNIGFCFFENGCPQNMLGILSDFVLSLEDIDFVVLCAKNSDKVNFSVRNELSHISAAKIITELLNGVGFGGGHSDMAGGIIPKVENFDLEFIKSKVFSIKFKN